LGQGLRKLRAASLSCGQFSKLKASSSQLSLILGLFFFVMRNLLFSVLLVCFFVPSFSQNQLEKIDSVCRLVIKNFNNKDATGLYQLTGTAFKKVVTIDKFKEISATNLFPLGELLQAIYEKETNGVSKYKAVFPSTNLAMYLSLDDNGKLQTFLFNEYIDERAKKITKVNSSNKLITALDRKVDSAVQPYISLEVTTGVSIGIFKNGRMYFYGYGETQKGNKKLPNNKTIFEIGSISKTFTAILLADAVNKGLMKLSDPASIYLPSSIPPLQFEGEPVTIRMLSNHSSALPRMPGNFTTAVSDPLNPYKNYGVDQLFGFLSTLKLERKPGSSYEYSNLAVATLGLILENIYKKPYEQLVLEKICTPLHMNDTRQFIRKTDSSRFAKGYSETGRYNGQWDFKAFAAAGSLRSTASDMLLYARANITAAPGELNKAIQLTHSVTFSDGQNKTGLAWHFIKPGNDEVLFHNGGTGGFRSYLAINKKKKFAVVVLSNTAIGTEQVGNEIMKWLEKH
jgi:CubicO group peptidase (beta-lactamase class C family)